MDLNAPIIDVDTVRALTLTLWATSVFLYVAGFIESQMMHANSHRQDRLALAIGVAEWICCLEAVKVGWFTIQYLQRASSGWSGYSAERELSALMNYSFLFGESLIPVVILFVLMYSRKVVGINEAVRMREVRRRKAELEEDI